MTEKTDPLTQVLSDHFVMWRPVSIDGGPPGEWRCACGAKFGLSDTAIEHQRDQVAALLEADARANADRIEGDE